MVPAPAPVPVAITEPPAWMRPIGTLELSLLERLFAEGTPGPIGHLMTISTLACTLAADGSDPGGFDAVVRANAKLLGRALVLQRLGKSPGTLVTEAMLEGLLPAAAPRPGPRPPAAALRREIRPGDAGAIAAVLQRVDRDPTVRLHLALLGLAADGVDGIDPAAVSPCLMALASYRANALAWLAPACAASVGQPAFVLPLPSPNLDAAGRGLVAALRTALA
jgi:hypothetical protein